MFKVTIISVGNLKEKYFAEAVKEYEKRISAYAEVRKPGQEEIAALTEEIRDALLQCKEAQEQRDAR